MCSHSLLLIQTELNTCEPDESKARERAGNSSPSLHQAWRGGQHRRNEKAQPNARRAFSFHFGTFTPFTMSQRQSDTSPMKASTRIRKIVPAYAGAMMSVKLFTR